MIKKHLRILLPMILIAVGILLALTASSFAPFADQGLHNTVAASLTPTSTLASAGAGSQAGTTDWITLVGVVIVLIIVLPVLFRRSTWMK